MVGLAAPNTTSVSVSNNQPFAADEDKKRNSPLVHLPVWLGRLVLALLLMMTLLMLSELVGR